MNLRIFNVLIDINLMHGWYRMGGGRMCFKNIFVSGVVILAVENATLFMVLNEFRLENCCIIIIYIKIPEIFIFNDEDKNFQCVN